LCKVWGVENAVQFRYRQVGHIRLNVRGIFAQPWVLGDRVGHVAVFWATFEDVVGEGLDGFEG
jgi:hypothetical protein